MRDVGQRVSVCRQSEVELVLIAHQRDVKAQTVEWNADRMVGEHLHSGQIQRNLRSRDVGDDDVERWRVIVLNSKVFIKSCRLGHQRRGWESCPVSHQVGRQRPRPIFDHGLLATDFL